MRSTLTLSAIAVCLVLAAGRSFAQPALPPPPPADQPTETEPAPPADPVPEPEPAPMPEPAPTVDATVTATSPAPVANDWTVAVAPRLGMTVPTSKLKAWLVGGVEIDFALPVLAKQLVVALDLSVTRPGYEGSGTDPRVGGDYDYSIDESELKIGLDVIYRFFPADRRLIPFAGLGPVIHMLRTSQSTSMAPGDNTAQDTYFGFELFGGVDYLLGPGYLLGELRVVGSNLNDLLTGNSNAGNVMLSLGYRIGF